MATEGERDAELEAIEKVIAALTPLDAEARTRVITYAFDRLGIKRLEPSAATHPAGVFPPVPPPAAQHATSAVRDIRTLRDEKAPRTANEMAALVAYYLSEAAPSGERKEAISIDDLSKYFKQANYPLPQRADNTLINAKNAGYLDTAGRGLYKLNPVGYNLVTQTLPAGRGAKTSARPRVRARQKVGRKKRRS